VHLQIEGRRLAGEEVEERDPDLSPLSSSSPFKPLQAIEDCVSLKERRYAIIADRGARGNLSYFAFNAIQKSKTLELFGRLPNPALPPSKQSVFV
jgi:hypothetical protein